MRHGILAMLQQGLCGEVWLADKSKEGHFLCKQMLPACLEAPAFRLLPLLKEKNASPRTRGKEGERWLLHPQRCQWKQAY